MVLPTAYYIIFGSCSLLLSSLLITSGLQQLIRVPNALLYTLALEAPMRPVDGINWT